MDIVSPYQVDAYAVLPGPRIVAEGAVFVVLSPVALLLLTKILRP